jgi:hypothetical protein
MEDETTRFCIEEMHKPFFIELFNKNLTQNIFKKSEATLKYLTNIDNERISLMRAFSLKT